MLTEKDHIKSAHSELVTAETGSPWIDFGIKTSFTFYNDLGTHYCH